MTGAVVRLADGLFETVLLMAEPVTGRADHGPQGLVTLLGTALTGYHQMWMRLRNGR